MAGVALCLLVTHEAELSAIYKVRSRLPSVRRDSRHVRRCVSAARHAPAGREAMPAAARGRWRAGCGQ